MVFWSIFIGCQICLDRVELGFNFFIMCLGPFKVLCHWGPLVALGIVKCICLTSLHCLTMWWPPSDSLGGFINSLIFTGWNGLVLYNFFSAMFFGPGYVPVGWKPVSICMYTSSFQLNVMLRCFSVVIII